MQPPVPVASVRDVGEEIAGVSCATTDQAKVIEPDGGEQAEHPADEAEQAPKGTRHDAVKKLPAWLAQDVRLQESCFTVSP